MAFKMNGWSAFTKVDDKPKKSGYETIRDKVDPGNSDSGLTVGGEPHTGEGGQDLTYNQLAHYHQTGELPDGTAYPAAVDGKHADFLEYMKDQPKIKAWKRKKGSKINDLFVSQKAKDNK